VANRPRRPARWPTTCCLTSSGPTTGSRRSTPDNGRTLTDEVGNYFLPLLTNGRMTRNGVGPYADLLDAFLSRPTSRQLKDCPPANATAPPTLRDCATSYLRSPIGPTGDDIVDRASTGHRNRMSEVRTGT
jgi:hypothetical protein